MTDPKYPEVSRNCYCVLCAAPVEVTLSAISVENDDEICAGILCEDCAKRWEEDQKGEKSQSA